MYWLSKLFYFVGEYEEDEQKYFTEDGEGGDYSDKEYEDEVSGADEREEKHHESAPTTYKEAKQWWEKLTQGAKKRIAKEEYIMNEKDKLFQINLKALLVEAEKMVFGKMFPGQTFPGKSCHDLGEFLSGTI